jgi:hypothetical protein
MKLDVIIQQSQNVAGVNENLAGDILGNTETKML